MMNFSFCDSMHLQCISLTKLVNWILKDFSLEVATFRGIYEKTLVH